MNTPLLSIVIPVYNVEKYIKDCLESIPSSCADKIEIILVDDCSKDNSLKIIDEFYAEHPGFKKTIIKLPENRGAGNARNTGIKVATGKYFLCIDSDDYLSTNSLEQILPIISANDRDIFIGKTLILNNNKELHDERNYNESFNKLELSQALDHIADNFIVSIPTYIFKRSLITLNNLYIPEFHAHEDDAWVPFVIKEAKSFMYIDLEWYIYRRRENSLSTTFSPKKDFAKLDIAERLYKLAVSTEHKKLQKLFYHKANTLYRRALRELHKHTAQDTASLLAKADNISYVLKMPEKLGNTIKYFLVKNLGIERYTKFNNSIKFKK